MRNVLNRILEEDMVSVRQSSCALKCYDGKVAHHDIHSKAGLNETEKLKVKEGRKAEKILRQ